MVAIHEYADTFSRKDSNKKIDYKDSKTKYIYLKNNFFGVFFKKLHWQMLLGSCMPSFIEVARLESCQKSEGAMVGRRKKEEIWHL